MLQRKSTTLPPLLSVYPPSSTPFPTSDRFLTRSSGRNVCVFHRCHFLLSLQHRPPRDLSMMKSARGHSVLRSIVLAGGALGPLSFVGADSNDSNAQCVPGWEWVGHHRFRCLMVLKPNLFAPQSYNSMGNNPCEITALLDEACLGYSGSSLAYPRQDWLLIDAHKQLPSYFIHSLLGQTILVHRKTMPQ